jgi:hypothetical protein
MIDISRLGLRDFEEETQGEDETGREIPQWR